MINRIFSCNLHWSVIKWRGEMVVSRAFNASDDPGKRVTNDTEYRTKETK